MTQSTEFLCASCGEPHGLPFAHRDRRAVLLGARGRGRGARRVGEEQCRIDDDLFVRGRLCIPVLDADEIFEWGVELESFDRMSDLGETPGREAEPPFFGWLSTESPGDLRSRPST